MGKNELVNAIFDLITIVHTLKVLGNAHMTSHK